MQSDKLLIEFDKLFEMVFQIEKNKVEVDLAIDESMEDETFIRSKCKKICVHGKDLNKVLCGIYTFFENCGVQFTITGEWFCQKEKLKEIPEMDISQNASVKNRGIRMHLNFVQDQSFFTEEDFRRFITQMSRMKMNYLLFHMYNSQEWYPFEYRTEKHLDLELGNLGRKPLPEDMIGRDKIQTKQIWYPKEFEAITDTKELLYAVHDRYLAMMEYAKEYGICIAASFEPEVVSDIFEQKLALWTEKGQADKRYNLTTDWQEGWSGKKIADTSIRNPILLDMAVERALSLYNSYPVLDELHLISREGTSFQADTREEYMEELSRLESSLSIHFTREYIAQLFEVSAVAGQINPKAYPYWTVLPGETYAGAVIGAFRYLEFACEILKDSRMVSLQEKENLKFVISLYSPNPKVISLVNCYAGEVIPKEVRFDILGDYGARDIRRQMDSWRPVLDCGKEVGMISWLEFDGNMALAQGWTNALYDNVKKAADMGIQTVYFNHWRLHSLEQNAEIAAKTCYDAEKTYHYYMDNYIKNLFGSENLNYGKRAYEVLEQATAYCKSCHYNIGFTNDWVYRHATDTPGYRWQELDRTIGLFGTAEEYFRQAAGDIRYPGAKHGEYMADMCKISQYHLRSVRHLQKSKLPLMGYGCFPVDREGNWPDAEEMKNYVHEAYMALQYTYAYMRKYSTWVCASDEQGQLAHHQLGMVEALENHYQMLKKRYEESVLRGILDETQYHG